MLTGTGVKEVGTAAYNFEDIATSLAVLHLHAQEDEKLERPVRDLELLYREAAHERPTYWGVTELTGQSMTAGDQRAGRGAWLLSNIERLDVHGVHSLLCHEVAQKFSAPLVDQVALALGETSKLTTADIQQLGAAAKKLGGQVKKAGRRAHHVRKDTSVIDVVGVHRGDVWLVQTLTASKVLNSALDRGEPTPSLFPAPLRAFENPVLDGPALATLFAGRDGMRAAFPSTRVRTLGLVLAKAGPDFELHELDLGDACPDRVVLGDDTVRASSLQKEYREQLQADDEVLWSLQHKLDDELFRGIPPCRGGRMLGMLALMAKRQRASSGLELWKEREFRERVKAELGWDIPRDKVRHDLLDRLAAQGFLRKRGNIFHLTVKGLARYLYCLVKYTTKAPPNTAVVLDECTELRGRIINKCGCP